MEFYKRDFLISRIIAGYIPLKIDNKRILVYHPSKSLILRANEIYVEAYENALEEDILTDEDIVLLLKDLDLWSDEKEQELEKIVPGHIEYWKIELYKNILKSNTRQTIRKYLETAKQEYGRLYHMRHHMDHVTCAGYANYVKNMFVVSNCARHKKKKIDWSVFDLNLIMNLYHNSILDADILRELARTTPWSNMWSVMKANGRIFPNDILTSEQQSLLSWSIMYERIGESPDCPPDEVIEDDDMLDGWLLIQKRQREANRKKQEAENLINSKISNADEVYFMAETPQDAQKIDLLNDARANQIKQQRLKEIKTQGHVLEQQLSDVRKKRAMELQRAYVNQVKGR